MLVIMCLGIFTHQTKNTCLFVCLKITIIFCLCGVNTAIWTLVLQAKQGIKKKKKRNTCKNEQLLVLFWPLYTFYEPFKISTDKNAICIHIQRVHLAYFTALFWIFYVAKYVFLGFFGCIDRLIKKIKKIKNGTSQFLS